MMRRFRWTAMAALLAGLYAACGGGGGSSMTGPRGVRCESERPGGGRNPAAG